MLKPRGDFSIHWELGRRFRLGEPLYANGLDLPYPPFFAMASAPLSLLPLRVAKPIFFLLGTCALLIVLRVLSLLSRRAFALSPERAFWVAAGALLIMSRFVLRDFDDGGQNLILLGLTWGAIYLWFKGKPVLGGLSLGFATALKCTPALFILYFAWKQQWKFAIAAALFAVLFTLAPAIRGSSYTVEMKAWLGTVARGVTQPDPAVGILGPEELQNKSLRPVLARYLTRLPEGHPGRVNSAAYVDFLSLPPNVAGALIKGALLLLLVFVVWRFAGGANVEGRMDTAWQCGGVSLLGLLYSPITWGQHCVAAIPALYFILRRGVYRGRMQPWCKVIIGCVAFTLILGNRSIIGHDASLVLESYHPVTFCLLALLGIILATRDPLRE